MNLLFHLIQNGTSMDGGTTAARGSASYNMQKVFKIKNIGHYISYNIQFDRLASENPPNLTSMVIVHKDYLDYKHITDNDV